MGKGAIHLSVLGRECVYMYMYVHVQSEGMAGLYHSPWLPDAEMQLDCKVLWKDRVREGLSESTSAVERWL